LDYANAVTINFPAMPDTIELLRAADYSVTTTPGDPDGIHVYLGTKPQEIPINFKLHSFDKQYCTRGALTLLQLAARLHSLVLPISATGLGQYAPTAPLAPTTNAAVLEAQSQQPSTVSVQANSIINGASATNSNPTVCLLQLIWIGATSPGICCQGYVKDVGVKLNGPWLRGPEGSYNLPTSGDFSFTFVHRPGFSNGGGMLAAGASADDIASAGAAASLNVQSALAADVQTYLYNTRGLINPTSTVGITTAAPADSSDNSNSALVNPPDEIEA
jgi:hypothetical protein